ncbi:MAG: universal stress protein [Myxococcaceae bacterium]|nr:universal stress protein [Myxococcaceae bacterium]
MLSHVLIAVDGSPPSRHAARFGLSLAEQLDARATLLTVLHKPEVIPLGPMATSVVTSGPTEAELESLRGGLDAIANEHPALNVQRVIELGQVAETIIEWAGKNQVDLIVVGARGLGPARRFLLGSISDRIVHHAHCPVTVWR